MAGEVGDMLGWVGVVGVVVAAIVVRGEVRRQTIRERWEREVATLRCVGGRWRKEEEGKKGKRVVR